MKRFKGPRISLARKLRLGLARAGEDRVSYLVTQIGQINGECIDFIGGTNGKGYGRLTDPRVGRQVKAHRFIFELAYGYLPPVVMHSCDRPICINPRHLQPGTHADNMRDMYAKGRGVGNARLTPFDRGEIVRRYERQGNVSNKQVLADEYGITTDYVLRLVRDAA